MEMLGGVRMVGAQIQFVLNGWWLELISPLEILQWNESKREKWENPKPTILGQAEEYIVCVAAMDTPQLQSS